MFLAAAVLCARPPIALADPCTAAQRVVQGKVAPCDGVLWPDEMARAALKCQNVEMPQLRADAFRERMRLESSLTECNEKVDAEQKARRKAESAAVGTAPAPVAEPPSRPFLEHPLVTFAAGLLLGAAGVIVYDKIAE